jgi:predicted AAA+ superfamily ATPase
MIKRIIEETIKSRLNSGKAIILLGPRQTGKTTLLEKIAGELGNYLFLNCDDLFVRDQLENANTETLKQIIGKYETVFIDEAQRVKNIGLILKIIVDRIKNVRLLVSGSSALELANEINEPLTGRKWEYMLFPISWAEMINNTDFLSSQQQLQQRLIIGMYPEIINNPGDEEEILKQLTSSYLYKDLLSLKEIRKPEILPKLLKALALQIGGEVSYSELANILNINKETVSSYIDLLEKSFIIFKLDAFSRNLRNEIARNKKIYFYDNGIRNALISNFNPLNTRQDSGALWENFLMSERKKFLHYNKISVNSYFWRTKNQQEIDYVEERGGKIYAFEFKYGTNTKAKIPKLFIETYKPETKIVTTENFNMFLTEQ